MLARSTHLLVSFDEIVAHTIQLFIDRFRSKFGDMNGKGGPAP